MDLHLTVIQKSMMNALSFCRGEYCDIHFLFSEFFVLNFVCYFFLCIVFFSSRMSAKIVSDVARSFSLEILSTKEATIKNILTFLTKPDENFLKVTSKDC